MIETKKMTVKVMREELLLKGINPEIVKSATKKQLKDLLTQNELVELEGEAEELMADVEPIAGGNTAVEEKSDTIAPKVTDIGWTDHVLTLFDTDREMDNGSPKVDGLRRVAELLFGEFDIFTKVVDSPNLNNAYRATVTVTLYFMASGRTVEASADVFSGNTDPMFARHSVASCESRAEGRALRKALRLTKVLSAEETYNASSDEPDGNDKRIPLSMINGLKIMAGRFSIDPLKTAQFCGFDVQTMEDLTTTQALQISNKLTEFDKNPTLVPDSIKV